VKQKNWLIVAVISLLLLVLVKVNVLIQVIMKFFVNNFANGRSDFKVISFLIYLIISSVIILFCANKKWKIKYDFRKIFLVLIGLMFIIGMVSFFHFTDKYDLDYFEGYKSIHEGKQSSTTMFHVHTFKAGLSKIIDFVNPSLHDTYDSGRFYANHLPSFFWIISLILMPILIILSQLVLIKLFHLWDKKRYKNFHLFIYIIASFSLLKNSMDGGLINQETFFWLAILLVLFSNFSSFKNFLKRSLISSIIAFLLLSFPFMFYYDGPKFLILEYLIFLSFFILLAGSFRYWSNKKIVSLILLLYLIFVIFLNSFFLTTHINFSAKVFSEMFTPVPENSTVYSYVHNVKNCKEVYYSQEDFSICKFNVEKQNMLSLWQNYASMPPNYKPIKINKVNCDFNRTSTLLNNFKLIDGQVPEKIELSFLNVSFTHVENDLYSYFGRYNSCLPQYQEVLQRIFNKEGIKSYIITN